MRNPTIASLLDLVIEDAGERDEERKKNGKLRTSPPDMDRVYLKIYLISELETRHSAGMWGKRWV